MEPTAEQRLAEYNADTAEAINIEDAGRRPEPELAIKCAERGYHLAKVKMDSGCVCGAKLPELAAPRKLPAPATIRTGE